MEVLATPQLVLQQIFFKCDRHKLDLDRRGTTDFAFDIPDSGKPISNKSTVNDALDSELETEDDEGEDDEDEDEDKDEDKDKEEGEGEDEEATNGVEDECEELGYSTL